MDASPEFGELPVQLLDYTYWIPYIQHGDVVNEKGKAPVARTAVPTRRRTAAKHPWQAPRSGWIKINTDGAYPETSGEAVALELSSGITEVR